MSVFLILFCAGAAATDLLCGRIFNKYLLCCAGGGVMLRLILEGLGWLPEGLYTALLSCLILLPMYLIRGLGGGDVKLICVSALMMTRSALTLICMLAFFLTAFAGIFMMAVRLLKREKRLTTLAFALPFLLAVVFHSFKI